MPSDVNQLFPQTNSGLWVELLLKNQPECYDVHWFSVYNLDFEQMLTKDVERRFVHLHSTLEIW